MMDSPLTNQHRYTCKFRIGAKHAKNTANQISVDHSLEQSYEGPERVATRGDWIYIASYDVASNICWAFVTGRCGTGVARPVLRAARGAGGVAGGQGGCQTPGGGGVESKHSTDVESTNRVRAYMWIHPEGESSSDLGSSARSQ